ncbi:superoxide dismutase [Cu-Zn]-like [Amblyraja radiata]|uniref:superoxide dismutase [Cu-Zn]-like n=1 Tax=Amblyraja radiata TaxID=386614 RepID=UPI001403EC9F|nr:superoxide dismutase [Cu-Zn]-like [Amblyraja radiata]
MIATGTCFMRGEEVNEDSAIQGIVTFEWDETEEVLIKGNIEGLKPGKHGLYVSSSGNVSTGTGSSGVHYNPCDKKHGGPQDDERLLKRKMTWVKVETTKASWEEMLEKV